MLARDFIWLIYLYSPWVFTEQTHSIRYIIYIQKYVTKVIFLIILYELDTMKLYEYQILLITWLMLPTILNGCMMTTRNAMSYILRYLCSSWCIYHILVEEPLMKNDSVAALLLLSGAIWSCCSLRTFGCRISRIVESDIHLLLSVLSGVPASNGAHSSHSCWRLLWPWQHATDQLNRACATRRIVSVVYFAVGGTHSLSVETKLPPVRIKNKFTLKRKEKK